MSGVNKVILLGRLGKSPECRTLENGNTVANFSIATSETYKDRNTGEKKEITEWVNIVLWKGLADIAGKYLKKGDQVYIEGKLTTRSWEKDGVTRYTTEVVGKEMVMLGGKSEGKADYTSEKQYQGKPSPEYQPKPQSNEPVAVPNDESQDLPF